MVPTISTNESLIYKRCSCSPFGWNGALCCLCPAFFHSLKSRFIEVFPNSKFLSDHLPHWMAISLLYVFLLYLTANSWTTRTMAYIFLDLLHLTWLTQRRFLWTFWWINGKWRVLNEMHLSLLFLEILLGLPLWVLNYLMPQHFHSTVIFMYLGLTMLSNTCALYISFHLFSLDHIFYTLYVFSYSSLSMWLFNKAVNILIWMLFVACSHLFIFMLSILSIIR